jgi:hypothetical protein
MAAPLQLASASWQYRLQATDQPPRRKWNQPVEAPQLAHTGFSECILNLRGWYHDKRISINGRNGVFGAYIAKPETAPAPAVVVLQEVFGVNADIRKHCDELAKLGYIAVAPDLFWRQEPGVDLSVTSEALEQARLR